MSKFSAGQFINIEVKTENWKNFAATTQELAVQTALVANAAKEQKKATV